MPKTGCIVGFEQTSELDPINKPGVYTENIVEKRYIAEILKNIDEVKNSSDKVNADISLSNRFSIVADPYAKMNFSTIRYLTFLGAKWRVSNVEVAFPRLIISVGGLYNAH